MRQSLSENPVSMSRPATRQRGSGASALWAAFVLSAVLAAAAIADQAAIHALRDYSTDMYARYDVPANSGALYAILYTAAVVGALSWLPAVIGAHKGRRWAPAAATVAAVIAAGLALLMFTTAEYGEMLFPPVWGVLALLPALAGVLGVVLLFRRK